VWLVIDGSAHVNDGRAAVIDVDVDILPTARGRMREGHAVDDYSFIDYGKGAGILASMIEAETHAAIRARSAPVCIVIVRRHRETEAAISRLVALADVVIRGHA
jgi:hypothetical protein